MSSFTEPLILKFLDTKQNKRFELYKPFLYNVGSKDSTYTIIVPKGFRTDFASIPRIFWRILPPIGLYGKAAVVHDYLYSIGEIPRKDCDCIFKEAMEVLKVSRWKRFVMYYGVRMGGMFSYINNGN